MKKQGEKILAFTSSIKFNRYSTSFVILVCRHIRPDPCTCTNAVQQVETGLQNAGWWEQRCGRFGSTETKVRQNEYFN